MRPIRGIFRVSVLATTLFALVGVYLSFTSAMRASDEEREMWFTLRCGERFLNRDMSAYTNSYGNIDIGKAGCSNGSFLARNEEILDALKKPSPESKAFKRKFWFELEHWVGYTLLTFITINVVGLIGFGAFKAIRWAAAGFSKQ